MALSNAKSQTEDCTQNRGLNFSIIRCGFASSLFATALLYLAGLIVLSCLLGVTAPAFAQTAPYLNANGWTVFTPVTGTGSCGNSSSNYTGTCVVFVSSSTGSDSTCAAQLPSVTSPSAGQACKTIAHGISLLRPRASADWLLLYAGDTFVNQDFGALCAQSGISATTPLLISAYGSGARPIVEYGSSPGNGNGWAIGSYGGGGCAAGGNNIAIVSIEFYNYTADPANPAFISGAASSQNPAVEFLNTFSWMLIEDCMFEFAPIVIETGVAQSSNLIIRRSEILDVYSTGSISGVYITMVNNILLQENIFDHNGWNATVPGAGASTWNHNLYLQCDINGGSGCNGPVTIVGNISSNAADGDQYRSGGTITDNTYIGMPYGHNIGQPYSGVQTLVNNNVHIEQALNNANGGTGNAIETINTFSSYDGNSYNLGTATFSGNIIAHSSTSSSASGAIYIDPGQVGTVVENNIACNWTRDGGAPSGELIWNQSSTSTLTGNYQDVADCNHNNYPSPDLTVGTYDTSLGTGSCGGNTVGTTANFICKARGQSKANWNNALMAATFNAYIAGGFGIASSSSTTSTSSSSTSSSSTSSSSTSSSSTTSPKPQSRRRSRSPRPQMALCLRAIGISTFPPLQWTAAAPLRRSRSQREAQLLRHASTRALALLPCQAGIFDAERSSSAPPRPMRPDKVQAVQ